MNEEVIREFLVSIGYRTDENSLKKFKVSLESITKTVMQVGAAVAATGAAVVAGVKVISNQMESLYYASQRTGETVGNLMGLRYAAQQVGVGADQAQASLEAFQRTLRLNPGTSGLLAQLGVTGNGPVEQFESFIAQTKKMQPYIAARYAELFGFDPDTLLMLQKGQDERLAQEAAYRKRLAAWRIDPDQAASAGKDFNNSLRSVKETFSDLWIVIESRLTPVLKPLIDQFDRWAQSHADEIARGISDAVESLSKWLQSVNWKKVGDDIYTVFEALGGVKGVLVGLVALKLAPLITSVLGLATAVTKLGVAASGAGIGVLMRVLGPLALLFHSGDLNEGEDADIARRQALATGVDPSTVDWNGSINRGGKAASPQVNAKDLFARLEESTGLPAGTLDNVWNIESGRGANLRSPAGAKGHFQFMDATARMYGITDPDNLAQSATGAARYLHDLMTKYGGDLRKALAAYNWGPGNLDKDIAKNGESWASFLPSETAGYLAKFDSARVGTSGARTAAGPVSITQQNTYNVQGSPDPAGTGRAVAGEQARVNADLIRNFSKAYS